MANRTVHIYKQVKIDGKWAFRALYRNPKNHKLEANKVLVGKQVVECAEGTFYLSWYEGEKKKWKKIGPRLKDAELKAELQQFKMEGASKGIQVVMPNDNRLSLEAAAKEYLEDVRLSRRPTTHELVSYDLNEFIAWSGLTYVEEVERKTLLKYKEHILRTGRQPRTAANKMLRVNSFIRHVRGLPDGKGLVTVRDAKVVEAMPEAYTPEELDKFFAKCDPFQHLLFSTFLMTGCRMKELMYLQWSDLDLQRGTLLVSAKPQYGFTTKTHEEREIPLPAELVRRLEAFRATAKWELVFPTRTGKPNDKWLYSLKRIARKAGVNCGRCETCRDPKKKECERWFLHKFRASYATRSLQSGIDIKTVQYLLGHKDIQSTMRYTAPLRNAQLREKVDAVWAVPTTVLEHSETQEKEPVRIQ